MSTNTSPVLIVWEKTVKALGSSSSDSSGDSGGDSGSQDSSTSTVVATGNLIMNLEKELLTYLAFTNTYDPSTSNTASTSDYTFATVAAGTKTVFSGITDTTGTSIAYGSFNRLTGRQKKQGSSGRTILIPLGTLTTKKGHQRYASIRFPRFFDLLMIAQATSQLCTGAESKPLFFKVASSGTSYDLQYGESTLGSARIQSTNSAGQEVTALSGAWVATSTVTTKEGDGIDAAEVNETMTDKGGNRKTKTS